MACLLSVADVQRLEAAQRVLLSPLDTPAVDDWRAAVNRAMRELLDADMATFMLPSPGRALMYGAEIPPSALHAYAIHYRALDLGLVRRRRELGLQVWSRRLLWDRAVLARSEYYADFVLPNRLFDAVGITIAVAGGDALVGISFHHERPAGRRFGARGLALLTLVRAAFEAGVRACLSLAPSRDVLGRAFDALGQGLVAADAGGRVVAANRAAVRLLGREPAGTVLRRELQRMLASLAHAAHPRPELADRAARWPALRELHLPDARYRVRGCIVGADDVLPRAPLLVAIEQMAPEPPPKERLRDAFGLTDRESDVALLLAEGKSNAQIATALAISPHTARHHSESVMLKVGVGSRAQVAAIVARGR